MIVWLDAKRARLVARAGGVLGFGVALIFFGVECVILGYLIHRSAYMPRSIGTLMQIAGVCYVVNSVALLLSPALSSQLFPTILIPSLIAELSLALWLVLSHEGFDG